MDHTSIHQCSACPEIILRSGSIISFTEPLPNDELLLLLQRQLHGRNDKYSSVEFKQRIAEDAMKTRIGDFKVGDTILPSSNDSSNGVLVPILPQSVGPTKYGLTPWVSGPDVKRTKQIPINESMAMGECSCQDVDRLVIQGIHLSGSKREGNDVRLNGRSDWSDIDVMLRLGPIQILNAVDASPSPADGTAQPAPDNTDAESSSSSSEINREDDIDAAGLEPTDHPGFVLLYVRPRADCSHSEWLPLSGDHVKTNIELIGNRGTAKADTRSWPIGNLMTGGPSLSSKEGGIDADLVPCFSLPRWPCEEFRNRPRPHGQPAPALVERLCRVAAMLVAVGFKGSDNECYQWRLSFSQHEYILLQSLTELQRDCLVVLKYCCAVLFGPHGPIKGAYLKMALLWECEETDPKTWEDKGLRKMTFKVLARLRDYVQKKNLPCYFWRDINMLAKHDENDLPKLGKILAHVMMNLDAAAAAVVAAFSWYGDSGVTHPNLPSGGIEEHWQFVMHRALQCLPTTYERTELERNFRKMMDKQESAVELMYQRVLKEMTDNKAKDQGLGAEPFKDDWLEED